MTTNSEDRSPKALEEALAAAETRARIAEQDSAALRQKIQGLEQELSRLQRSVAAAGPLRG